MNETEQKIEPQPSTRFRKTLLVLARITTIALAWTASPSSASSVNYVDAAHGNDGHPGTLQQPWRTFGHAVSRLAAGDTLYVRQGDYRNEGVVSLESHGSRHAPIRILAWPREQPVVLALHAANRSWLEIAGLKIIGPRTPPAGWREMPDVVIDNPSVRIDQGRKWHLGREQLVREKFRSYAQMMDWEKAGDAGVRISASHDIIVRNNDISLHCVGLQLLDGASRILVKDNHIHHCYDAINGGYASSATASFEDCIISQNQVRQIYREGIRLTGKARRNTVEGNDLRYTGHSHIATFASGGGNVIRHNTLRYGGYYTETMRWPGSSGISIHSAGPGSLVDGNTIAYQYDGGTQRDGNGIISDYNPDGAVIVNNVIYRVVGSGISSVHSGNNVIVNNTIVEAGFESPSRKNGVAVRLFSNEDVNNVIANNIFFHPLLGGILSDSGQLGAQRRIDHNLFALLPRTAFAGNGSDGRGILRDLVSYQRTGHDAHAVLADPQFADVAAEDFRLRPTSPAIKAGAPKDAPKHDLKRAPRDLQQPTIGAFEAAVTACRLKNGD